MNNNEISKLDLKKCLDLKDEEKIYQFLFDKVLELGRIKYKKGKMKEKKEELVDKDNEEGKELEDK